MADNRVNPTEAKDVALYFYKKKDWKADARMGRAVNTVKSMMKNGFTKDQIISAIDYLFATTKVDIFSIGFISYNINEALDKLNKDRLADEARAERAKLVTPTPKGVDDGSSERNKQKLDRNSKSNIGKKYNFDMFKE